MIDRMEKVERPRPSGYDQDEIYEKRRKRNDVLIFHDLSKSFPGKTVIFRPRFDSQKKRACIYLPARTAAENQH